MTVRRDNLSLVLGLVHRTGGLSRSALTESTGLNRSTVADLVERLVQLELVAVRAGEPTNRVGRPSPAVVPHPSPVAIAVNPEVDAITIAVVGLSALVEHRVRIPMTSVVTPEATAGHVAEALAGMKQDVLRSRRIAGIGLAVPGLVRAADGVVRWAPHLNWTESPLASLVHKATGLPAFVGNDASLGALAEHRFGAGRGIDDLVYINGGASGIGGGVIAGGIPLSGTAGFAGEFGQSRPGIASANDAVTAGGTLEQEVSRSRLLAAVGLDDADEVELHRALLASTDRAVLAELARQRRVLGVALSNAIDVLNPAMVLLGGFLATVRESDAPHLDNVTAALTVPAAWECAQILPAALGPDLLMIGAAELAFAGLLANPLEPAGRV